MQARKQNTTPLNSIDERTVKTAKRRNEDMPRNKVEMKLIEDLRKRKVTFKNRSDGLVEKTRQLAILCGCDALCICTAAGADGGAASVKTWPEDPKDVQQLIRKYRDVPADLFRQVLTPLSFNEEELKEQGRVVKVQQCGPGELGPWDSSFDDASTDFNAVLGKLDETMQKVQQRMVALSLVRDDMTIVPASSDAAVVVAAPVPHAMSLPDSAFVNFGGSLPDTTGTTMVTTQYYDHPHDHQMLPQPFPFPPACHGGYQMRPPYLSYQQMPPEFSATGYATNVANWASASSEFYDDDDLMQHGFDAGGGAYVSDDVLGQAFSAGPPSGVYHFAQPATVGVWPVSKPNHPMDGAAFQLRNDFAGPPEWELQ